MSNFELLDQSKFNILNISNPTIEEIKHAIDIDKYIIKILPINILNNNIIKYALDKDPSIIQFVEQTEELCLYACENNGFALYFVKNKTNSICLAAVNQNPFTLYHVPLELQTTEICNIAINANPLTRRYVKI